MYGAVRERARNSSQLAGLSTAVLMTTLVGYALANGMGGHIARMIEQPMTFTPIIEDHPPVEQRRIDDELDTSTTLPPIPSPLPPDIKFTVTDDVIIGPTGTNERIDPGPLKIVDTVIPKPVRTRPMMLTKNPPPYPASEIRRQNEGVTGLDVCIDAGGRVSSASLASSSGHPNLDDAALKWVRTARFTPGKVDGVAQPICGHNVVYEWKLENAR